MLLRYPRPPGLVLVLAQRFATFQQDGSYVAGMGAHGAELNRLSPLVEALPPGYSPRAASKSLRCCA